MKVVLRNPQEAVTPMMVKLAKRKKINKTNLAIFLFPTQLLIQVQ